MKNIQILQLEKYSNSKLYQPVEKGIYKDLKENYYCISFSFELEGTEREDTQYPLEDILDKYMVHVSDFIESGEEAPFCMKVELSGTNLKNIQEAALMEGKRIYNQAYTDETDGEEYLRLVIEENTQPMKAIVCTKFGRPDQLELQDIPSPKPKAKEVLIQVNTASVNFPDTLIIQGLYQFKPDLPFTPGSDVAGTILEVGEGVKHLKVGDAVFGTTMTGAFAEQVVVPISNCFPKPLMLEDGVAASFMIAYGTSMHALKDRAKLQAGETLLVLGAAGGVGLAAVEIGKAMGATVIAAASTDEKLALCKEYGATHTINYTKEDLKKQVKALTDGKGVDVIYDPVGGDYSEAALRAMGWNGRFLVVGFATGTIPKIPLNLPLLKSCQIVGVFWGSFAQKFPSKNMENVMQLLKWYTEKKIKPHIHQRYSLADTPKALEAILNREVRGKVVIDM